MTEEINWRFNPGDRLGINDSGIETFRGQMITSLGREICQNSIDAVLDPKEKVTVEFKEFKLEREKVPGIEGLTDSFNRALKFWSQDNNCVKPAINFFEKGLEVLKQEDISVLRISDFNTTGLLKSKEHYSSPWINLVTASGVSQKGGTAGGSFGIGKSAPFVCTDLRTVFYSTLDKEGVEASQGVSRIATFKGEDGRETSGKGYYGRWDDSFPNGNAPIYNQISLEPDFKRVESGTDIYILGFKKFENWKEELLKALLEDFLISIYKDKLKIIVDDIVLNRENLDSILNELYNKNKKELTKTYNYYQVLVSDKSKIREHIIDDLGKIEFKFLLGADVPEEKIDFHRQALVVRETGMKLFDRGYISGNIPFAGILTLVDEDVNSFFRLLEPPRHDAWEADLYEGDKSKTYVKNKIQEVYGFMKDTINELGSIPVSDEMDAIGLGNYLPDEFLCKIGKEKKEETISSKSKSIEIVNVKKPKKRKQATEKSNTVEEVEVYGVFDEEGKLIGGKAGNTNKKRKNEKGKGGTFKESDEGTKINKLSRVRTLKERIMLVDRNNNGYKIVFELEKPVKYGYMELFLKREEGEERAVVSNVLNMGGINFFKSQNRIYFSDDKEFNKFETNFELQYKDPCSLEVKTYGNKL